MQAKLIDWSADIDRVLERFGRAGMKFSSHQSSALILFMASQKIVSRSELEKRAASIAGIDDPANFINTTIGNTTIAIHGEGDVPDPGGWYFRDEKTGSYVLDRNFALGWIAAQGSH